MTGIEKCGSNGGTGIGAGHVCVCEDEKGHPPITADRPHGCACGALWAEPEAAPSRQGFRLEGPRAGLVSRRADHRR